MHPSRASPMLPQRRPDLLDFGALISNSVAFFERRDRSAGPDAQELEKPASPPLQPAGVALSRYQHPDRLKLEFVLPANPDAHPVVTRRYPWWWCCGICPPARSVEKTIAHESNIAAAAPTVNNSSSTAVQAPVVTFKLALANQPNTNESMPIIQTAKVNLCRQSKGRSRAQTDFRAPNRNDKKILVGAFKG